jgi:O-antigen/teichoic acid export membrane protein
MATALLFFLNSILALYILLYYSQIMEALYLVQGKSMVPFYIFAETLPGLLFFSAITSQEPLYEMVGKVDSLQKTVILVALLNLVLNWFFIPFAGFYGAAFATSASMFAYFMLFGKRLHPRFGIPKIKFIIGGTAVYLTYMFMRKSMGRGFISLFP